MCLVVMYVYMHMYVQRIEERENPVNVFCCYDCVYVYVCTAYRRE
jgi:hypothetical protein